MIKAHRLRRGLGQIELSAALGWNASPSRISRYEQGRVVPSRSTLDRLADVFHLARDERGVLLMQAGYLPTDEEVATVLAGIKPFLEGWKGPAYLTDFTWRFLGWNRAMLALFGFPPDEIARLDHEKPNLLELAFDPRWATRRHLPEDVLTQTGRAQIARFKAQHRDRTEQRWYRQLLQRLLRISLFRDLWNTTSPDIGSELMHYVRYQIDTPDGRLEFHAFASEMVADPRFFVILWLPADETTARLLA
ncbi:MAG: helix-turn-helix domain-containing protein [Chloroflexi bacterium]|nr:helix-turn-helix domain-containing protein [Chloroflexota bacterium]